MNIVKKLFVVGVVAIAVSACAAQASAHWWWGAAPVYRVGWSAYDPCCGYGYYAAYRVPYRSYRWGCGYGWSCCYDPCCVSCCGYSTWSTGVVSSCGCDGVVVSTATAVQGSAVPAPTKAVTPPTTTTDAMPTIPATPTTPATLSPVAPAPAPAAPIDKPAAPATGIPGATPPTTPGGLLPPTPTTPGGSSFMEPTTKDSGFLTVWVPYEAKVTINGLLTKSTGSRRTFVSYGLVPGYTYKYEVKAEIVREGKIVTETQTISLTAGERGGVAFGFNTAGAEGLAQVD